MAWGSEAATLQITATEYAADLTNMFNLWKRKKKTVQYEVVEIKGSHAIVETNHGRVRKQLSQVDPQLLRAFERKQENERRSIR